MLFREVLTANAGNDCGQADWNAIEVADLIDKFATHDVENHNGSTSAKHERGG